MSTNVFDNVKVADIGQPVTPTNHSLAIGRARKQTNSTGSVIASGVGSLALGDSYGQLYADATLQATGVGAIAAGQLTPNGYPSSTDVITASGAGSFAHGFVERDYYAGNSGIVASGNGSLAQGHTDGYGYQQILASGVGAIAGGEVNSVPFTPAGITASGIGSIAVGKVPDANGNINATASGAFAHGETYYGTTIQAGAIGSIAQGHVTSGKIQTGAGGLGSIAAGFATGYSIYANGSGSLALGVASTMGNITAAGSGSLALGSDYTTATLYGEITATAASSVQIGPGVNNVAGSLKVGAGVWLCAEAPGSPANGQIWLANDYVYIRSNGSSVKIGAA